MHMQTYKTLTVTEENKNRRGGGTTESEVKQRKQKQNKVWKEKKRQAAFRNVLKLHRSFSELFLPAPK